MEFVVLALAIAFGFVLGVIVGARRALSMALSARSLQGVRASVASFMPPDLPTRSAKDLIAGRIRVVLGDTIYELVVLPKGPSRRWLEQFDVRFATLALQLDQAGNDVPTILAALLAETDGLYDMLLSYDEGSGHPVLPPKADIDEIASDAEILHAVTEVWRAVNPLVATLAENMSPTDGTPSAPSSSPLPPTAGRSMSSSPG